MGFATSAPIDSIAARQLFHGSEQASQSARPMFLGNGRAGCDPRPREFALDMLVEAFELLLKFVGKLSLVLLAQLARECAKHR